MSFAGDMEAFAAKLKRFEKAMFVNTASHVLFSIKKGSVVTSAPGQPVDTGNLLISWQLTFPAAYLAEISTSVEYAPVIEDHEGSFISSVGGAHSVRLTQTGWERIVDHELALLQAGPTAKAPATETE